MSVGKNSIKRAAGKAATAPKTKEIKEKDEVAGAAPELANSCSTPAKAVKKAPAKKAPAKTEKKATSKKAEKPSANLRPETAAAVEATVTAPVKVQVTEELPYYLL